MARGWVTIPDVISIVMSRKYDNMAGWEKRKREHNKQEFV